MTPEPNHRQTGPEAVGLSWREILQTGADIAQADGFNLERLIDRQPENATRSGEGR